MKDRVSSLLLRVDDFPPHPSRVRDTEAFEIIRRSLNSIKLEISLGTSIDPSLVENLEIKLTELEKRSK